MREFRAADWDAVDLVAFDVDGTLYRQRRLRLRMARDLALDALGTRSLRTPRILAAYRRIREQLAEDETADFAAVLLARAAEATGVSMETVRQAAAEWIDGRPLRHLAASRYPGVADLFRGLRRAGKTVGILSDYPVAAKLAALGLEADHMASAADAGIGRLKPHPLGLMTLIAKAGADPSRTLLIGDRVERDGAAAVRAGARALIRSSRPVAGWTTFARFDDPIFLPVLTG